MMGRDWMLALGAGLCAGLLPGCLAPRMDHVPADLRDDLGVLREDKPRGVAASPYDAQPAPPPRQETPAAAVEPVRHTEPPSPPAPRPAEGARPAESSAA